MSEMVERVARVIDSMAWAVPWEDYPAERARREARQAGSLMTAKRAIEAMRGPTEIMISEAIIVDDEMSEQSPGKAVTMIWWTMIDAALK